MTDDIRREVVKALAYGKSIVEIRDVMGVSAAGIKKVSAKKKSRQNAKNCGERGM